MTERRRSWWGWGWEDEALGDDRVAELVPLVSERLGAPLEARPAPRLEDLDLPAPRVAPPPTLVDLCSTDRRDRALHAHGRAFRDVARAVVGDLDPPPDLVVRPRDEADVVSVLDWCSDAGVAVVPFGGGTSVVGGVSCAIDDVPGVVSLDLGALDRVLEVDAVSRAARIQAGARGPVLEDQLRPDGLTLRHFPQSFEFSTLGGWLATRAGGHYATVYTHIDDLVESMRVVTPTGVSESRRLPGSGAGPSPDRLFLGSEGTLGVITEAWMRVQDRPRWKTSAGARFADWAQAVEATRAVAQSGLFPTNCRLLDPGEAAANAGVDDGSALLLLGFESADHPVDAWMGRAVELVTDHGATVPDGVRSTDAEHRSGNDGATSGDAVDRWRSAFLRAPYGRDALVRMSVVVETFETACTWDRFGDLHDHVTTAVRSALDRLCGGGTLTCRFTHVYPDGPAPYYTVMAPGRPGDEVAIWDEVKALVSDAVLAGGGTITHHHAVGRDHRAWFDRQRPEPVARAQRAAKAALDPAGVLNPGVLDPPTGPIGP